MGDGLRSWLLAGLAWFVSLGIGGNALRAEDATSDSWRKIAPAFEPPKEFAGKLGEYRSPLLLDDGRPVRTVDQWQQRRKELLDYWHGVMGAWPEVITKPQVETLETKRRDNFTQHKIRFALTPRHWTDAYLLVPDGEGRRPAVLVVYYEPETAAGLNDQKQRDFAYQLARRGFVALSVGTGASIYYPNKEQATLQPLSALAYAAANSYQVLAARPEVDPRRVAVMGHSYGGKWALFAAALYDKFAAAVVSDPGIVFDEQRGNVNYWEPWYLGYEQGVSRKAGIPSPTNPRTGAYKKLVADGRDLHELLALVAPRPLLVSGGSEDSPRRWLALNHAVAVNSLLGQKHRVAMTNRSGHTPTEESNEQIYQFLKWCLAASKQ